MASTGMSSSITQGGDARAVDSDGLDMDGVEEFGSEQRRSQVARGTGATRALYAQGTGARC